jgi:hypothetical protein
MTEYRVRRKLPGELQSALEVLKPACVAFVHGARVRAESWLEDAVHKAKTPRALVWTAPSSRT